MNCNRRSNRTCYYVINQLPKVLKILTDRHHVKVLALLVFSKRFRSICVQLKSHKKTQRVLRERRVWNQKISQYPLGHMLIGHSVYIG